MAPLRMVAVLSMLTLSAGQWQFWSINDIHYDPTYNSTGESCLDDVTIRDPRGHYECDAPWDMVLGAVRKMSYTFGVPEFIIWGGANSYRINATKTVFSKELLLKIITNITELFRQEFPNIQVVPVLGADDWYPKAQLPAEDDPDNLYNEYYEIWKDWLPEEYEDTFKRAGYYTISLSRDRLTAIVLNTALYLPENNAVTGSDPGGQFQWLTAQLTSARQQNKKVHIFTHVPVGSLKPEHNTRFIEIIREYHDVIVAIYGGYEGTDQFKLINDKDGNRVAFVLVAPSLSPRPGSDGSARNSAFRRYYFDLEGGLNDVQTYHLNIAEGTDWGTLYSYSGFGMSLVNINNLDKLVAKMEVYGSQEFHDYHRYKHVGIGLPYYSPCSCECKFKEICAINNVDTYSYENCLESVSCGVSKVTISTLLVLCLYLVAESTSQVT